ncbi:MAG: multidrug efflux RND transporter permease subunit [Candidatus Methylacidiphilales bacterium]|nr:multidrug efflux RND transporter permease subunit [Candidatus Methylacidiphilales bacterium]
MNISEPFIRKPVATTLLTIAIALSGILAFQLLPVAPLPRVEFPTIQVSASLPGASPEIMASSVATPLERQFGRIAGVTEMTSGSSIGSCNITLQFELNRDIDAAARDVQSAINAARGFLPANLPSNPRYRKVNPSDAPIIVLALTSDTLDRGAMYDAAATILQQKISQVDGVGQVNIGGSSLPAVRVDLNPTLLNKYSISSAEVRTALSTANSNIPKGQLSDGQHTWVIKTNDQLFKAAEYKPLLVAYRNGIPVRLSDIADVYDSVEDLRNAGFANGKPAVLLNVSREPGANIIEVVDKVRGLLPYLRASIPQAMNLDVMVDQTVTIRASIHDVEVTLILSVVLVIIVVYMFLGDLRATLIPGVAVPISLLGTFGVMYLLDYSLDNLSLMALTISTGFVVDDAIVVVENISRYIEKGMKPFDAALRGAREIGFTVVSISISLVAVFIPLLLMGGIIGRLFREFAVTLSVAIMVSMVISLTTTPMMCALLLRPHKHGKEAADEHTSGFIDGFFLRVVRFYDWSLTRVLRAPLITLMVLLITIVLNVHFFLIVPKGFFPQQDTGRLNGGIQSDQAASFEATQKRLAQLVSTLNEDPAIDNVIAFTGRSGGTRLFASLKPLSERKVSADQIIARLRQKVIIPGASLYLQSAQDLRIGGRPSNAQYQYTLQSESLQDLTAWAPKLLAKVRSIPQITDANSDQENRGLEAHMEYDRATSARLGITAKLLDDTLYDAFGQRQVSTIYALLNQYRVVMGVAPAFLEDPESLRHIYVHSPNDTEVPMSSIAKATVSTAPLSVNHQGPFPAITLSFNLRPGLALGDAVTLIDKAALDIGMPASVRGTFQGTAKAFQSSLDTQPLLIAAAIITVYIVLGMLYESYIHPITILSTLPSAGVGAVLALLITGTDLSIIAMIGVILLIGIVKKNAILMIDFALEAERKEGKSPRAAIHEACMLRFRPIIMTTMAALLGALPLAFGTGTGSELRYPLGVTIIGGLIVSQVLTLYTTPVIYLYFDRARLAWEKWGGRKGTRMKAAGKTVATPQLEAPSAT